MKVSFVQAIPKATFEDACYMPNLAADHTIMASQWGWIGYGMLHVATATAEQHDVGVYSLAASATSGMLYSHLNAILASDVVGIQLNWGLETDGAIALAQYLKHRSPDLTIVVGGTHASLFADDIARLACVDFVIRGEGELAFPQLLQDIAAGRSCERPGVVTADCNGGIAPFIANLDDISPYQPSLIRTEVQNSIPFAVNRVRGSCPWECGYCLGGSIGRLNGRDRFVRHSPAWITKQMDLLLAYDPPFILFEDQAWAADPQQSGRYLKDLSQEICKWGRQHELKYGIAEVAPPCLADDAIEALSHANVVLLDYGCESGSSRILKRMGRRYDAQGICNTIRKTAEAGILPRTWWMGGFPGEDEDDIQATINAIHESFELGGYPVWITPVVVLPETPIARRPDQYGVTLRWDGFEKHRTLARLSSDAIRSGEYEDYITHEEEHATPTVIVQRVDRIRREIVGLRDEWGLERLPAAFLKRYPQLSIDILQKMVLSEREVEAGFF